jgi:hypothetical protein
MLVRLDPKTAKTLERHTYPSLRKYDAWAVKFWGGYFWIFLGQSVYRVSREDLETVIADTGRHTVGVGVSSCAPIQKTN